MYPEFPFIELLLNETEKALFTFLYNTEAIIFVLTFLCDNRKKELLKTTIHRSIESDQTTISNMIKHKAVQIFHYKTKCSVLLYSTYNLKYLLT